MGVSVSSYAVRDCPEHRVLQQLLYVAPDSAVSSWLFRSRLAQQISTGLSHASTIREWAWDDGLEPH